MKACLAWMGACSLALAAAAPPAHADCGGLGACVVGVADYAVFMRAFLCVSGDPCYDRKVDYDSDGIVGAKDFFFFQSNLIAAGRDVTRPAVLIKYPMETQTLSGVVTISVSATDAVGVRSVDIFVEGIDPYPVPIPRAPYQTTLDTRSIPNGEHIIRANAYDVAGNVGSHRVPVRINNPVPAPAAGTPGVVIVDDLNADGRYTGEDLKLGLARCAPGCTLRALSRTYEDVEIVIPAAITNPVIIEGAGMGQTVFRSPVPWLRPVVTVSYPNPLVTFRDLTIDGRKAEQISSFISRQPQTGIRVSNPSGADSGPGIIERVEVKNMLNAGIALSGGSHWIVRHSRIHDAGCSGPFACPNLARIDPGALLNDPTWRSIGYGIVIESSDNTVHDNEIWNVNKVGIEVYEDPSGLAPGSELMSGFHVFNNHVHHTGSGIGSNGGSGGRIEDNTVTFSSGHGVFCGAQAGEIVFENNLISDSNFSGLWVSCHGPNITVTNNRIWNNCRTIPGGASGLLIDAGTPFGEGNGIRIENNFVVEPSCRSASFVAFRDNVQMSGNLFIGGSELGTVIFQDATDIVVSNTHIYGEGRVPAGIYLLSNIDGLTVSSDVMMTGNTLGNVIASDPATVTNVVVE